MEQSIEVSFDSEQSMAALKMLEAEEQAIMASQTTKAEDYVSAIKSQCLSVEDAPYKLRKANEALLAIVTDYEKSEDSIDKLLKAELLADTIINMIIKEKILNPKGSKANTTLDYRGEIFVLGVNENRLCNGCSRPVVFPSTRECTSCRFASSRTRP